MKTEDMNIVKTMIERERIRNEMNGKNNLNEVLKALRIEVII